MRKFNEWMSFRQTVEETLDSYGFIGTYNSENLSNLEENSERIEVESAIKLIPQSYRGQFQTCETVSAGKSRNESNAEIVWISNNDQGITYIFEKKTIQEMQMKDINSLKDKATQFAGKNPDSGKKAPDTEEFPYPNFLKKGKVSVGYNPFEMGTKTVRFQKRYSKPKSN